MVIKSSRGVCRESSISKQVIDLVNWGEIVLSVIDIIAAGLLGNCPIIPIAPDLCPR